LALAVGGGQSGVRDMGLLESAIYRPQTGYYADLVEMAAALMESLLINHPFLDGNKRTALVSTDTFLRMNGYRLELETDSAHDFVINTLGQDSPRFDTIAGWVRGCVQSL
jgi:death-on-curing protein